MDILAILIVVHVSEDSPGPQLSFEVSLHRTQEKEFGWLRALFGLFPILIDRLIYPVFLFCLPPSITHLTVIIVILSYSETYDCRENLTKSSLEVQFFHAVHAPNFSLDHPRPSIFFFPFYILLLGYTGGTLP